MNSPNPSLPSINRLTHEWACERGESSHFFPQIPSTNQGAKDLFPPLGQPWAVYLTDRQTRGRGRGSKRWSSGREGQGLLSTWCFRCGTPLQPIFTPLLGLGLYGALEALNPSMDLKLKPPNDIWLSGGKLSGLLVEVHSKGPENWVYIGLGLNVFGAPQVDIPTSFLSSSVEITREGWFGFCSSFLKACQQALVHGKKNQMSETHARDLLRALQGKEKESPYRQVYPNADLETGEGRIPWQSF